MNNMDKNMDFELLARKFGIPVEEVLEVHEDFKKEKRSKMK